MTDTISQIQAQLAALQLEVKDLRGGYLTFNRRYTVTIESLRDLTNHASEAAKFSSLASLKSVAAAKNAVNAAADAVEHGIFSAIDFAARGRQKMPLKQQLWQRLLLPQQLVQLPLQLRIRLKSLQFWLLPLPLKLAKLQQGRQLKPSKYQIKPPLLRAMLGQRRQSN